MLWLGIDGALGAFSAAVCAEDGTGPVRTAVSAGSDALERGIAVVEEVLAGEPLSSLGGIAVGVGPGSFTGLRIALSYAKSFAYAANVPLAGVSSYDALSPAEPAPVHATFVHGRTGIACVRFRSPAETFAVCGPYAVLAGEIADRVMPGSELICYGASEGVAPALGERGIIVRPIGNGNGVPARSVLRSALTSRKAGIAHALRADYGEAHYAERAPEGRLGT